MRQATLGLALTVVLLAGGCSGFNNNANRKDRGPAVARQSRWDGRNPTAATLVSYLNENSKYIPALQCADFDLDCQAENQRFSVASRLDCQKPRNFRLTGRVVGQPMVDIGSNDQEFWYWISKNNPPYVFHCSQEALARGGVRMPFPFQPEMALAALGMTEYDPSRHYEVKINPRTVELIEEIKSPQGQPIQKVVVFQRSAATGNQPQISGYLLRDAKGRDICKVTVAAVSRDSRSGVELPQRINFSWPDQRIEMKMNLANIRVVSADPEQRFYNRRNLASQQSFDLEKWQLDSPTGQVQRVGAPPR